MPESHSVEWRPSGRGKARCAADPAYPDGVAVDVSGGATTTCRVDVPYPAPACGAWLIHCPACRFTVLVTAAGRDDDPRSVLLPCTPAIGDAKPQVDRRRLRATFTPEAWVDDSAIAVDGRGRDVWDCTNFVERHPELFGDLATILAANGSWLDKHDALWNDPEAPSWIRDWDGPFTIVVTVAE